VYCQDTKRREAEHNSFDFLGYIFRGRRAKGKRGVFTNFSPAMSTGAKKAKGRQIREWHLIRRSGSDLSRLAEEINPQVRGWINPPVGIIHRADRNYQQVPSTQHQPVRLTGGKAKMDAADHERTAPFASPELQSPLLPS